MEILHDYIIHEIVTTQQFNKISMNKIKVIRVF